MLAEAVRFEWRRVLRFFPTVFFSLAFPRLGWTHADQRPAL